MPTCSFSRRAFLRAGSGALAGLAFGTRPWAAWSAVATPPQAPPPVAPLARERWRFAHHVDRFGCERRHRELEPALERLQQALPAGGADLGALDALAPARETILRRDAAIEVRRGEWAAEANPAGALGRWLARERPLRAAAVACTAIREASGSALETDLHFELASAARWQASFEVRARWRHDGGAWRLEAARPLALTTVRARQAAFVDTTTAAFGGDPSYGSHLVRDTNYWRTVLDAASGIDIFGNYGVSVADIDGDGHDEIYLCQPQGLPNRLYRQIRPGEFAEIGAAAGVDLLDATSMALFADLRNSGRQDLVLITQSQPLLLLNNGRGQFAPAARAFPVAGAGASLTGAALADYDGDGFLDLYVCSYGYFQGTGANPLPSPYWDAHNGPPNHLYRNRGDGTFEDRTEASGLDHGNDRYSFACLWTDLDGDGRPDLCVINDFGQNNLYRNRGDGTFEEVAGGIPGHGAGMSATAADFAGVGLELYVGNMWSAAGQRVTNDAEFRARISAAGAAALVEFAQGNALYRAATGGGWERIAGAGGAARAHWAWSCEAVDFDNDGRPDLYCMNGFLSPPRDAAPGLEPVHAWLWQEVIANSPAPGEPPSAAYRAAWTEGFDLAHADHGWNGGEANAAYVNLGNGEFAAAGAALGLDFRDDGRAFAVFDFDGDGDADLVVHSRTGPQLRLLRNDLGGGNRSLAVRLEAARGNRDGIGARLEVASAAGRQVAELRAGSGFLSQHSKTMTFGLGTASEAEITVTWPSGHRDRFEGLRAGFRHTLREGGGHEAHALAKRLSTAATAPRAAVAEAPPATFATVLVEPLPLPAVALPPGWTAPAGGRSAVWLAHTAAGAPATAQRVDWAAAGGEFRTFWRTALRHLYDRRREVVLPTGLLVEGEALTKVYWGGGGSERLGADLAHGVAPGAAALPFAGQSALASWRRDPRGLGAALESAGLHRAAALYLAQAAAEFPSDPETLFNWALARRALGERGAARQLAERALGLRPRFAAAENLLGALAMDQQRWSEAQRFLARAVADSPEMAEAWNNLGYAQMNGGATAAAAASLRRALALAPDFADALNNSGILAARRGDWAQAERRFRRALAAAPNDQEAGNNLAVLYAKQGAVAKAEATFRELLRREPEARGTTLNFARLEAATGGRAAAAKLLREWLARHPDDAEAQALLAKFR